MCKESSCFICESVIFSYLKYCNQLHTYFIREQVQLHNIHVYINELTRAGFIIMLYIR